MTVTLIFTWMHLSDAFIESDMFLNSFPHLMIVCVCFVQVWPVRSRSPATRTLMRWWRSGIVLQTCCWDPQTTPPVWTCGESPARLHPSHSKHLTPPAPILQLNITLCSAHTHATHQCTAKSNFSCFAVKISKCPANKTWEIKLLFSEKYKKN